MKLIVEMNRVLQKYIPGKVGRYNDAFEARSFGDNIQKWGTSTILVESGGYPDDLEKQEIRKLNYIALLSSFFSISTGNYNNFNIKEYDAIPHNQNRLFDIKLTGMNYSLSGREYNLDLGINQTEVDNDTHDDFHYRSRIADFEDLSTNFGYKNLNVSGSHLVIAKVYPQTFENIEDIKNLDFASILADGYAYVKIKNLSNEDFYSFPIHIVGEGFEAPGEISEGANPTFFLEKDGKITYAVINGFIAEIREGFANIKNTLILP